MATVNVYLTFNGNCKKAFEFYKKVFNKEFAYIGTFGEMPPNDEMPVHEDMKDKIMHVCLPISNETMLMASDNDSSHADVTMGTNFAISINATSQQEADELFENLSENGTITMPLQDTFWGAYFGMLTDNFGINWMVNYDREPS